MNIGRLESSSENNKDRIGGFQSSLASSSLFSTREFYALQSPVFFCANFRENVGE